MNNKTILLRLKEAHLADHIKRTKKRAAMIAASQLVLNQVPSIALTLYIHHSVKYSQPHCEADPSISPAFPVLELKWRKIKRIDGGPTAQYGTVRTWTKRLQQSHHAASQQCCQVAYFRTSFIFIVLHMFYSLWLIFFYHYQKIRIINEKKNPSTCSLASHIKPFSQKNLNWELKY